MRPKELTANQTYDFLIQLALALKFDDVGTWVEVFQNMDTVPPETFVKISSATVNKDKDFRLQLMAITADWGSEK